MKKLLSVLFSTLQGGVRGGLLFLLFFASAINIYASDIKVGGIWYDFDSSTKTASVTYRGDSPSFYAGEYSGSVIIPETVTYNGTTYSVTSIGVVAFYNCSSLTSVTISNSVTRIGESAFEGCSSLTSVTIGESVTSIGDDAFYNCSSLTSITIPNSVTSIGNSAFAYCSSLTSVTIGESVTSIGDDAFYYCYSLTSVTIGESVTSIGDAAFYYCYSLTSVTIGESVTSIGDYAFYFCSSLTSITIPNSVTSIGDNAFRGCDALTSITIPNSVTSIEDWAFGGCSKLTSVTIGESVTSIGSSVFFDCYSLTSVTIGESVKSIGEEAFSGCSKLTSVTINSGAIVSKDYSSYDDNISDIFGLQVTEYIIGNKVKGIGSSAFNSCSSLTSVTIPNSVTSIGGSAFYGCSSLTKTNYTGDIAGWCNIKFGNWSANPMCYSHNFYINDQEIKDLVIPNSVTSIGDYAFEDCSSLTSVTIPNSVTSIGESTFEGCFSLTKTNYTGDIAGWCNIIFGNNYANPMHCSHNFYINDQEIKDLVIPNNVTSIGYAAFQGCSSLTSITCEAATSPTISDTYTFYGVSKSIPVYVPCGCVEAYKAASGWSDFTNIQVPLLEYSIEVYVNDTIMGTAKVNYNTFCEGNQISAIPNIGYHFVQWSDGNTENPRTLELTQDTILIAEFAQSFSGQCGDSLYWEFADETLHITGSGKMYDYNSYNNFVPWTLLVTSIKFVTIGESVTSIGSYAFNGCSSLTSVTIPESVTSIGFAAFRDCSSLTSVTIPESVTSIGSRTFEGCSSLTKTNYTGDIAGWCNIKFGNWSANPMCYSHNFYINDQEIKDLVIPNSVTSIGDYAFEDCSSLTSVTIPNSVTSIGESTFEGCSSLTSVTIPNSVTSIGGAAFYGCSSLSSITIPNSVTSIESYAFYECSSLTSVTIPNSVTWIGHDAFRDCSSLTSVTIPESVTGIEEDAFYGCSSLTSVTIPNSVKTIGTSAFEGCARLGKISLGTGLEEIAANAFAGCTRLYDIYVYATYPPFAEESSFANYNVYVYIPCEYQRDYILDVVWGEFKFIECIDFEEATTDGNVTIVPGFNDVTITWPTETGADSYTIVIKKGDTVFCTLTFSADGQLLNIAFAPGRDGNHPAQYAEQAGNGYRFTVTGLEEGTQYAYNITTKDAANKTIATYSGEFTTMGGTTTDMDNIQSPMSNCQKLLRNGQLLIIRDAKTYNVMGQEM